MAACSSEDIKLLADALRSDPERHGLRSWKSYDRTGVRFPGLEESLLEEAFHGRRIILFGDSTLRNLNRWMFKVLVTMNSSVISSLSSLNLSDANAILNPYPKDSDSWRRAGLDEYVHTADKNGTELVDGTAIKFIDAARYHNYENSCPEFGEQYEELKAFRPQIVVA